ncbi:MAG: hypothetical protein H7832_04140 [Magnetococcus sp. DMHC-6]
MTNIPHLTKRFLLCGTFICVCLFLEDIRPILQPHQITLGKNPVLFWTDKISALPSYDILFLGDSRTLCGIDPIQIEKQLPGVQALNFAFSGGGLNPELYQLAQEKIRPGPGNRMVVLGITPQSLTKHALDNHHYHDLQKKQEWWWMRTLHLYGLHGIFEPFKLPLLVNTLKLMLSGKEVPKSFQEFHPGGWLALWAIPPQPGRNIAIYDQKFVNNPILPELEEALFAQTKEWHKKGWQIISFRPPAEPDLIHLEMVKSHFNEQKFIQKFQEAGGVWLNFTSGTYHTYDGDHLEKKSAIQFSQDLSRPLAELFKEHDALRAKN